MAIVNSWSCKICQNRFWFRF